jgi:hypothetical protein
VNAAQLHADDYVITLFGGPNGGTARARYVLRVRDQ